MDILNRKAMTIDKTKMLEDGIAWGIIWMMIEDSKPIYLIRMTETDDGRYFVSKRLAPVKIEGPVKYQGHAFATWEKGEEWGDHSIECDGCKQCS